ncbi:hypothetical protein SAY87_020954 [Trapa incisa]|uniref:Late embryogenesis abundant protein n=1 Tax=Trapa incisa TaxID=236973 RepID=A0AAN7JRJ3_9MYRT|nr:hypothetical protein SAY87_020954 [Trapa incisa]
MAKFLVAGAKELLLSSWKQPHRGQKAISRRLTGIKQLHQEFAGQVARRDDDDDDEGADEKQELWVPHPRTGIYVPRGHESVIDDIPQQAASLAETYWLRDVDGADKPDPDLYT